MSERWVPFDVADCDPNPFVQFNKWFDDAKDVMREREAIALSTSTPHGHPSTRMVLLRHIDDHSFGWYTNYLSHKGHELLLNPFAAILWYCEPLGRQIRMEGAVSQMSALESDEYFNSRPRGHQIGAHASDQSAPIASRAELENRVKELEIEFEGKEIPRPLHWGGYRLEPTYFEFWQHRTDRLHDRVFYTQSANQWKLERHCP